MGGSVRQNLTNVLKYARLYLKINVVFKQGNLPTINDDETNQYVSNLVGGAYNWIGAYRVGPFNVNDQFAWIDGSPLVYAPWSDGNPSNSNGNEFCVQIMTSETYNASWNDYDVWSENGALIEIMDFACQRDPLSISKPIEGGI